MRRVLLDLLLFLLCASALYFLPDNLFPPIFQSFAIRVLCVSAAFLHAHVMRQLAFPYIDFSDPKTPVTHEILVIALYCTVMFCYARGG